jgi:hypothetical protein
MPQTLWTQATTAILAQLNATGAPATFYRARFAATGSTETAGNVFPTKIDCKYDCDQRATRIDASIVVRVDLAATDEVDLAVDYLILWAWKQIRMDPTLGLLVEDVYVDNIEIGYLDKSSSDKVCVDITVRVEVSVGRDDPSQNKTYGSLI